MLNVNEIITTSERENIRKEWFSILPEYDYAPKMVGFENNIDEWAINKAHLIEAFKKHPNYIEGKFMIAFSSDLERTMNPYEVTRFGGWLYDYDTTYYISEHIPEDIKKQAREDGNTCLPDSMYGVFNNFKSYAAEQFMSEETAKALLEIFPFCHARKGKKTSRVINEICTYLGYTKHPEYNRRYANFANALSPIKYTRHTILSIHPMDFLTMSFGNSWTSCHTIDKRNKRRVPGDTYSGMHSTGTLSYMLDGVSMIFYTVDTDYKGTDFWTQPKIDRQMFHFSEDKLVQGRLYPQSNDGDGSAYTPYRNIVQNILSIIFDFPNLWTVQKGTGPASRYILTRGTHYADYCYSDGCTLSCIKGKDNEHSFIVGHNPICIECGEEHDGHNNISCCTRVRCRHCGYEVDRSEAIEIDGNLYCCDCVCNCDECGNWHLRDNLEDVGGRYEYHYVCEDCRDEYFEVCEDCGYWHRRENMYWIEGGEYYVCGSCIGNYEVCDECGDYYRRDDLIYIESEDVWVCDYCCNNNFTECSDCEEYIRDDKLLYDDDNNPYCPECYANLIAEDVADEEEAM